MSYPGPPPAGQQPPYVPPPYGQPVAYSHPLGYGAGYPPPSPPRRKPGLRWWQWLLLAFGGVIFIACCAPVMLGVVLAPFRSGATTSSQGGDTSQVSQASAHVGDTLTVNGVSCTLISVKIIPGDESVQPKPGNEFIVVHVKLINNASGEFSYNSFDFHIKSGTGNITDPEIESPNSYTTNNELPSATLAAGGSVEGDIIFQVTKGDHQAQMTWSPTLFSDKTSNAWNLGL